MDADSLLLLIGIGGAAVAVGAGAGRLSELRSEVERIPFSELEEIRPHDGPVRVELPDGSGSILRDVSALKVRKHSDCLRKGSCRFKNDCALEVGRVVDEPDPTVDTVLFTMKKEGSDGTQ